MLKFMGQKVLKGKKPKGSDFFSPEKLPGPDSNRFCSLPYKWNFVNLANTSIPVWSLENNMNT